MDPRITNDLYYLLLTGTVLPLVIALVNQRKWSSGAKAVIAAVVCLGGAVAVCLHAGAVDPKDIAGAAIIVITVAKALYEGFWKPTGIAPAIEGATSKE